MKVRRIFSALTFITAMAVGAAQQIGVAPLPVAEAAYVKYGSMFYVFGGRVSLSSKDVHVITPQFYALDLARPWTSEAPGWIELPQGPKKYHVTAAISLDGQAMTVFPGLDNTAYRYSFASQTWSSSRYPFNKALTDVCPVTLGTDGTVLVLAGFSDSPNHDQFDIYSFALDWIVETVPLPPYDVDGTKYLVARGFYKAAWSKMLEKVVVYGGLSAERNNKQWVSLYDPKRKEWSSMTTSGINTNTSVDHCMALNDEGTKLYTYGGRLLEEGAYRSNLYILDLQSGVWTEGADSKAPRAFATCTVAGDHFILWGGINDVGALVDAGKMSTPVLIYRISEDKWVEDYQPSAEYLSLATSSPTTKAPPAPTNPVSEDSDGEGSNIGAIVGATVGAVVVLVGVLALFLWRRKRASARKRDGMNESDGGENHKTQADVMDGKHEYYHLPQSPQALSPDAMSRSPHDTVQYIPYFNDSMANMELLQRSASTLSNVSEETYAMRSIPPISPCTSPMSFSSTRPSWATTIGEGETVERIWFNSPVLEHATPLSPHAVVETQVQSVPISTGPRNPHALYYDIPTSETQ